MLDATATTAPDDLEVDAPGPDDAAPARKPLRRRLLWPFGVGLFVQVVLVLGDKLPSVDSVSYFETGHNFVSGNGYTRSGAPELHFPPITPVGFGLLEKLTGSDMWALRSWNLIWGMAAVLLLTAIGWYLSRDDDATVATAWLSWLVPGAITLSIKSGSGSELTTAVFVLGAALLTLWTLDTAADRSKPKLYAGLVGGGALVGLAYLTRPESLMPGATIGLAVVLVALRDKRHGWGKRFGTAIAHGAAFGLACLVFIAPYVNYQHSNTGTWALTSKTKDASIDAWRAVAENDRLERDQILYAIQPDGVSLGPETRSLTAIAREHPRGWLTIAWTNTTTILGDVFKVSWKSGPVWELMAPFILIPALVQIWRKRRNRATLLFAVLAAWPLATCFLFFALPRYMIMTIAALIPFGAWGLADWTHRMRLGRARMVWWAVGILSVVSFLGGASILLPWTNRHEHTEQRTVGEWIDRNTPKGSRIMTRSFIVQGYSHRDVVAMPSAEYRAMLEFARRKGVDYIVADESTIKSRRPEVYDILMQEEGAPVGLKLVHQFEENHQLVKVYQLDPPAPKTNEPPLFLGYVAD
ncbi:MAG: hypothetical protein U0P45_02810 [Acidimicrobiales bacterium]